MQPLFRIEFDLFELKRILFVKHLCKAYHFFGEIKGVDVKHNSNTTSWLRKGALLRLCQGHEFVRGRGGRFERAAKHLMTEKEERGAWRIKPAYKGRS